MKAYFSARIFFCFQASELFTPPLLEFLETPSKNFHCVLTAFFSKSAFWSFWYNEYHASIGGGFCQRRSGPQVQKFGAKNLLHIYSLKSAEN